MDPCPNQASCRLHSVVCRPLFWYLELCGLLPVGGVRFGVLFQVVVFANGLFFLCGFIAGIWATKQINDAFASFPFRFSSELSLLVTGLVLNSFSTVSFLFGIHYLHSADRYCMRCHLTRTLDRVLSMPSVAVHMEQLTHQLGARFSFVIKQPLTFDLRHVNASSTRYCCFFVCWRTLEFAAAHLAVSLLIAIVQCVDAHVGFGYSVLYEVMTFLWLGPPFACSLLFVIVCEAISVRIGLIECLVHPSILQTPSCPLSDVCDHEESIAGTEAVLRQFDIVLTDLQQAAHSFQVYISYAILSSFLAFTVLAFGILFVYSDSVRMNFFGGRWTWVIVANVAFCYLYIRGMLSASRMGSRLGALPAKLRRIAVRSEHTEVAERLHRLADFVRESRPALSLFDGTVEISTGLILAIASGYSAICALLLNQFLSS
jgi:hypothetical protein